MTDHLLDEYSQCDVVRHADELLVGRCGVLGGFCGGSLSFFLSAWAKRSRARRSPAAFVLVTGSQEEADEITEELETFAPGQVRTFPAWESLFLADSKPDPEIRRGRLSVLDALSRGRTEDVFIVAPVQAVIQPVPPADVLRCGRLLVRSGEDLPPADLAQTLTRHGYRNVALVEQAGEFSVRGDILDVYPLVTALPLRLEYFGDAIESIREFSPTSQRSVEDSRAAEVELLLPVLDQVFVDCFRGEDTLLLDYLGESDHVLLWEAESVFERSERIFHNILGGDPDYADEEGMIHGLFLARMEGAASVRLSALPAPPQETNSANLRFGTVEQLRSVDISQVFDALQARLGLGFCVRVYCENEGEAERFAELLEDNHLGGDDRIELAVGGLRRGFEIPDLSRVVVTSRELFNRHVVRRARHRSAAPAKVIQSFLELQRGDHVVHVVHGIGRYHGIETLEKDGVDQEFLTLEFRGDVRVYVPVSKIDLVQKYVGSGDKVPTLDKVGGTAWAKKKESVENALLDLAAELLDIQASRMERPGIAHPPESDWQREFEASFPFSDTPDQVEATVAIKGDMTAGRPMDRLICGDVGYGKTELAMRAAFKAVEGGKQVAVLVPTTLLAEQHFRTFRERMAEFPVTVEVLSRFRTKRRQREIVQSAEMGGVDVLVGTHRLLSNDVRFNDLGLVVIDEEQRFGVAHKEKLKRLRSQVDVLTLSATPIPRTLHMALLGIRDISSLTTAPEGRTAIRTEITHFDRKKIREVIIRELNRDGQVYFVHNRVKDIDVVRRDIEQIVPEARVVVAHGQLNERDLESRMVEFMERRGEVLLATTIIENGIDIPTVNTIVINEADRHGLADLHQLRGRVGRYKHQAYCYLVLPDHRHVNADAKKRMQALVEFSGLGSGFQIAMRDLEIRGAGNILGKEQSGHIATVGYDLYCRLLEKCVRSIRKEEYHEPVTVEVDLALDAYVPDGFLANESAKIEVYRRISTAMTDEAVADLGLEFEDRYGKLPRQFRRLLELQEFRLRASSFGIDYIGRQEASLLFRGGEGMGRLLESCPLRIVALDARTVAIPMAARGGLSAEIDDSRLFELLAKWLRSGTFPTFTPRRRRFVDIRPDRGTVTARPHGDS